MASNGNVRNTAFDAIPPVRSSRLAGARMAGFRGQALEPTDLRAIPHPAVTLAIDFGAEELTVDGATAQPHGGGVAAGLGFEATRVRGSGFECVQVRLCPTIAYTVLGVSPVDLSGPMIGLTDLWGREVAPVRELLSRSVTWTDRFTVTEDLLLRRYERGRPAHPEVVWAWHEIMASRGLVRVDRLADQLGWSRQRLWSRFRSQIGLSPKCAAKLVRFDHAARSLAAGQDAARVASNSGYTDQSHLHRDVVQFAGMTPASLAGEPFLAVDDIAWGSNKVTRDF